MSPTPAPSPCVDSALFALQVTDASMAPEFPEGCIVIADPGLAPGSGSFVVAASAGGLVLRQLRKDPSGCWLETLGPDPQREPVAAGDIRGTVIQRAGRRRRDHKHYGTARG